jgi:hypothetical protein
MRELGAALAAESTMGGGCGCGVGTGATAATTPLRGRLLEATAVGSALA